jgi:acyl carrier protein
MTVEPLSAARCEARLRRIFDHGLQIDVASVDTDLFDSGLVDSLTFVDLLLRIEEEFGRRIALDRLELTDFQSISSIARLLSRNGAAH